MRAAPGVDQVVDVVGAAAGEDACQDVGDPWADGREADGGEQVGLENDGQGDADEAGDVAQPEGLDEGRRGRGR